jgi:hypothetical protein
MLQAHHEQHFILHLLCLRFIMLYDLHCNVSVVPAPFVHTPKAASTQQLACNVAVSSSS